MTQQSTNLPTASAAGLGIRPETIKAFAAELERRSAEVHGLAIVRRGHLVQLGEWAPWQAQRPTLVYSVSKTLTASCVGLAIADGHLSLDDPAIELLGRTAPSAAPQAALITVRHLLSMSTGHTEDTLPAMFGHSDPAGVFFATPTTADPGSVFCYNNGATWMLGELVRRATGHSLVDFATERFLAPLGIRDLHWQQDDGKEFGFSGCFLTVEQIAAIAELYRCDGIWQGTRLLPEGWVAQASAEQISTAGEENPYSTLGYGFQLWGHPGGFRLDGAFAQYGIVLPEQEAVIAVTSGQFPSIDVMQPVLEILQPGLLPLPAEPMEIRPDPCDQFSAQVSWPAGGEPVHAIQSEQIVTPQQPEKALDQWWFPEMQDAEVFLDGGVWRFRVRLAGQPTSVELGTDDWLHTELLAEQGFPVPVATRVRRSAGQTEVCLCFIDTPHRLLITLTDQGTAFQQWSTPPLNGAPLAGLSRAHQTLSPTFIE